MSRWPLLLLTLTLAGCALDPVDLFCDAVADASADPGWADASADAREAMVSAAWPGGGTDDIWRQVPDVSGFERWMRAVRIRDLAPAGTKRAERCAPAIEWVAQDNWQRNGLTVALGCDGLGAFGPDGTRHSLGPWPPAQPLEPMTSIDPLLALAEALQQAAPEPLSATVVLPASYAPTVGQAMMFIYTLNRAHVGPIDIFIDPDESPLNSLPRWIPPPPGEDRGPVEQVRVVQVDPVVRASEAGLDLGFVLAIQATRPGGAGGLAVFVGDPATSGDPWLAAERAAWRKVQLADEQGCLPLRLAAEDVDRLQQRVVELLRPYDLAGVQVSAHLSQEVLLSVTLALEQGFAELGVATFGFTATLPVEGMACEDVVRSPEELAVVVAEQRAAAEALYPTAAPQ